MLNNSGWNALAFAPIIGYEASLTADPEWTPAGLVSGWSEDGTTISFPIASLIGLTEAAADATTGDARQVALSLCQSLFGWYNDLGVRPQGLTAEMKNRRLHTSGVFSGSESVQFLFQFYTSFPSQLIADEPE